MPCSRVITDWPLSWGHWWKHESTNLYLLHFGWTAFMPAQLFSPCFTELMASLLWNLHKYYAQFSDCIQARISQLRQPIEKELKVCISCLLAYHISVLGLVSMPVTEAPLWCFPRILSRSQSGTMSVFGPSNSQWRRPIGNLTLLLLYDLLTV